MSLGKDKGKIVKYGGGILRVIEVDDAGADLSPTPDTVKDLGYVEGMELYRSVSDEKISDETGAPVKTLYNDIQEGLKGNLLQSDKDTLDFLKAAGSKYYRLYYKMSKTNEMNGTTQELFAGIASVKPMFSVKAGSKKIPIEISFNTAESAISITTPKTQFGSDLVQSGTVTIAAGTTHSITEN